MDVPTGHVGDRNDADEQCDKSRETKTAGLAARTAAPIGANYNAISALLGIPVGTAAGYTPPVYRAPPVYMSDEQRKALMPQPFPVQQPDATGVVPPMGGAGPADEGAPLAPLGPAPFNPNAYDYSGNLSRGYELSGADIGRFAANAVASTIPVLGIANTVSSLFGGPNVGSAIFGAKQPEQPLTSIAYDPKFQAAARARGDIYYDPFGGYYTGDQALGIGVDREYQDWLAGEQARQTEAGSIGTDYGYVPDAAHQEIGPVDYGYVPDADPAPETPEVVGGGFDDYPTDGT